MYYVMMRTEQNTWRQRGRTPHGGNECDHPQAVRRKTSTAPKLMSPTQRGTIANGGPSAEPGAPDCASHQYTKKDVPMTASYAF